MNTNKNEIRKVNNMSDDESFKGIIFALEVGGILLMFLPLISDKIGWEMSRELTQTYVGVGSMLFLTAIMLLVWYLVSDY